MTISEQLQAADTAIQAAEAAERLALVPLAAGAVLLFALAVIGYRYHNQGRKRACNIAGGFSWAIFLTAMIFSATAGSHTGINRALAKKEAACEAAISEVAETGRPDAAKAALTHDCSREKLLIAALSSSNGLTADLAKALISDHGDPGS